LSNSILKVALAKFQAFRARQSEYNPARRNPADARFLTSRLCARYQRSYHLHTCSRFRQCHHHRKISALRIPQMVRSVAASVPGARHKRRSSWSFHQDESLPEVVPFFGACKASWNRRILKNLRRTRPSRNSASGARKLTKASTCRTMMNPRRH
jgi:hypothetical protein